MRELKGPITLENGAIYEGEWFNGLRDGKGLQKWLDGSCYDGHWVDGKACG